MVWTLLGLLGGASLVFLSASTSLADGITLSVIPADQSVTLGAAVNVSLTIQGLGDQTAPSLGVYDLNLGFDPGILSFDSVVFGDPLLTDQLDPTGLGNTINSINPTVGSVELFELSLDGVNDLNNLQAPGFVLAALTFDTIGIGTSSLVIDINALGDAAGNALSSAIQNGTVDVYFSEVPEPFGVGLIPAAFMLAAIHLRRRDRCQNARRGLLDER